MLLRFFLGTSSEGTTEAKAFHDFFKSTRILTEAASASTSFCSLLAETKVHPLLSACPLRCATSTTTSEELLEYVIHVETSLEPGTCPLSPTAASLCLPLHPFLA